MVTVDLVLRCRLRHSCYCAPSCLRILSWEYDSSCPRIRKTIPKSTNTWLASVLTYAQVSTGKTWISEGNVWVSSTAKRWRGRGHTRDGPTTSDHRVSQRTHVPRMRLWNSWTFMVVIRLTSRLFKPSPWSSEDHSAHMEMHNWFIKNY
jgi:hypothetical protein